MFNLTNNCNITLEVDDSDSDRRVVLLAFKLYRRMSCLSSVAFDVLLNVSISN
jgi:hypothetical protein